MIHISIPTYQTLVDRRDPYKKYNVFDIHLNGVFHSSVRYSVMCALHEKLVEIFGFRFVAQFPPKKVWRSLDTKELNQRRETLSKYFQAVIQNSDISKHILLERAFLEFQVNSFMPAVSSCKLEIYLADGNPIKLECYSDDSTNIVLKKCCEVLGMNTKYSNYFGLFLGRPRNNLASKHLSILFDYICIRWLKNFESPYISLQLANKESVKSPDCINKILLRRVTWDPSIEEPLLDDFGCLKVLYLQALNDIQRGQLQVNKEIKEKLAELQEQNSHKQFVRLCQQQSTYGYELMAPVVSDYPKPETTCDLKVGRRQIVLEYEENGSEMQTILRSTRIRVWSVSHTDNQTTTTNPQMTFQIEYLMAKNEFGLITINTFQIVKFFLKFLCISQAVILSLFLQSIAAEILHNQPNSESTDFKFDDDMISTKVIKSLENSKANSIINEDLSIKDGLLETNGNLMTNEELFKIISYQMPFDNNENFEDLTDSNL